MATAHRMKTNDFNNEKTRWSTVNTRQASFERRGCTSEAPYRRIQLKTASWLEPLTLPVPPVRLCCRSKGPSHTPPLAPPLDTDDWASSRPQSIVFSHPRLELADVGGTPSGSGVSGYRVPLVTGIKVFYVADNSAENIVRLYANPLTTAITDLAGCRRVVLGPGMAMYAPPGSPHKVYNLTPDKGSLAVSWDFRVPAITIPLLKKLKSLLRRRASREAVIQFAYEVFESEADGYTLAHAEQDIDDELAHLAG